jgi:hypothetical protein
VHPFLWAAVFLPLGVIIVLILFALGVGVQMSITLKDGVSVFAVSYVEAQFVERMVEPLSEQWGLKKKKARIDFLRRMTDANDDQKLELDMLETERMWTLWSIASFMGIILSYFTIGLLQSVGALFSTLSIASLGFTAPLNNPIYPSSVGHLIDSILTGVIIGGGTKPLHDLISYIETAGRSKKSGWPANIQQPH